MIFDCYFHFLEFTSRGNSLADLEAQLEMAQRAILNQQVEIETSHNIIVALQQDLEKSVAAQKTLLQQLHETEAESKELQDFLQSEKNTLQDALREAEKNVSLTTMLHFFCLLQELANFESLLGKRLHFQVTKKICGKK